MALNALLLCAGLGTRLRPYSHLRPKPALPFWGLPLCYYSLYFLKNIGVKDVTINLHHLPEKMNALALRPELSFFNFDFSLEKEKAMGSGGALYYARKYLQKSSAFFAINSDEVMIPATPLVLENLAAHFLKTQALATLLVTDHPDLQKTLKPVWINAEGVIRAFGDKPETTETLRPVHYTGYKIFSKEVLPLLPPGESHIFHDTLVPALKKGALVNTLFIQCRWWETGSLQGLLQATGDCTRLVHSSADQNHFRNVYKSFDADFSYSTTATQDKSVAIHKSAQVQFDQCQGTVFVGAHASAAKTLQLKDCLIEAHVHVLQNQNQSMLLKDGG